jgi:hypothetical protein
LIKIKEGDKVISLEKIDILKGLLPDAEDGENEEVKIEKVDKKGEE